MIGHSVSPKDNNVDQVSALNMNELRIVEFIAILILKIEDCWMKSKNMGKLKDFLDFMTNESQLNHLKNSKAYKTINLVYSTSNKA